MEANTEPQYVQVPGSGNVRAVPTGDPLINFQLGIDGPVAELMIGQPKLVAMLGDSLFRTVRVPTVNFQYRRFGLERFETKDAKRGMRAQFQFSELEIDTVAARVERFGWATLLDRDEIMNAEAFEGVFAMPLRIRERHQILARNIVDLSLERLRADVALAAASYSASAPDLDVTLAGGSEWDAASADSRDDIRTLAALLCVENACQPENLKVTLSHESYRAAQDDATFLALRGNFATQVPNTEDLRAYWGVGAVEVGDAYEINAAGDGVLSMYGDVAIITVMQPLLGYDDSEGQLDNFVKFKLAPFGSPISSYFRNDITSWVFPWEDWEFAGSVSNTTAAIIRNTVA